MIELIRESSSRSRLGSLAERIYRQLKQDVADFRLLPGDRFTESEVAQRTGASRTPVREALFRLQREGYVEALYRNGWRVRPFDFVWFENLYELRTILELAAVRTLCDRADRSPALDELERIWLVPVAERLDDAAALAGLDEQFHALLVSAAGNDEMARVHQEISEKIRIIRRLDFTQWPRIAATYDEHGDVLRAILRHRTEQAQRLLKAHIDVSRDEVRKITLHMLHRARQGTSAT